MMDQMKIDQATGRRLALAKKLYMHGCTHASNKDEVSRMIAIHNFDNAAEFLLKVTADHLSLKYDEKNFFSVLRAVQEHFQEGIGEELPLEKEVSELHKNRNRVQHGGVTLSTGTVERFKESTGEFFRSVISNVFQISYDEVSLALLIDHDELRQGVLRAELALEENEYERCIGLCDDALNTAAFDIADIFFKAGLLTTYWGVGEEFTNVIDEKYSQKYVGTDCDEVARELSVAIRQVAQASTAMQFLGGHRGDFLRLRKLVQDLPSLSKDDLKEGAHASLEFVSNIILEWQEEGLL